MHLHTKQDLAVTQFLKELFSSAPSVDILDSYPDVPLEIPCIVVDLDNIDTYTREMGTRELGRIRTWYIDIYATSKIQRDEMSYMILDALENKINVYDYDQGFPPTVIPKIGVLDPDDIQLKVLKVLPDLTERMYYRAVIIFTAIYENI